MPHDLTCSSLNMSKGSLWKVDANNSERGRGSYNKMHDWHFKEAHRLGFHIKAQAVLHAAFYPWRLHVRDDNYRLKLHLLYLCARRCCAVFSHISIKMLTAPSCLRVFDAGWRNRCQNAKLQHKSKAADEGKKKTRLTCEQRCKQQQNVVLTSWTPRDYSTNWIYFSSC